LEEEARGRPGALLGTGRGKHRKKRNRIGMRVGGMGEQ